MTLADRAAAPDRLDLPAFDGLTWRPLERADTPGVHALVAAIEDADAQPFRTSLAEIGDEFDDPGRDPAADTVAAVDGEGRFVAYGGVATRPGDASMVRVFLHGGVLPERRGEGLGRAAVAWMTGRARQVLAASDRDLPGRILTYLEYGGPAAERRLYERAGFGTLRYYATLRRDLADPIPVVDLPDGLRLEPWAPALDEAVRLAHNDAFRDHWGSEPQSPEVWAHGRTLFAPQWSAVVVDPAPDPALVAGLDAATRAHVAAGGTLVAGYQLAIRAEQDWAVQGYTSGYTDALGVRRAYRGRHLAPALLAAAMRTFAADGMQYAALDVDTENPTGAYGLYSSLGYEKTVGSRMLAIEL
ncbi:putative acetyltransferase, GNAT [Luteimicrobium album]|uniref:Acetyltransferase, GNAT n=1 Tax=Luteimicrobium album TaxID=1054550 RepID=A0ABQ6I4R4_9MICO|nr:GNAT family N-acetyltransferase [Luteimicrobium album]GMA25753.1 putative acetyltransferase, GNAT [Luteimicrobium album]